MAAPAMLIESRSVGHILYYKGLVLLQRAIEDCKEPGASYRARCIKLRQPLFRDQNCGHLAVQISTVSISF